MSGREDGSTPPAGGDRQESAPSNARALEQARELGRRIADLAERIAESEDMVASAFEDSALIRPHAQERLRSAAAEARRFAEEERDHGRRMRQAVRETPPPN